RLEVPGLELVAAAKEAGMLDDLYDRVAKTTSPAEDHSFRRAKEALSAVVLAALGRDKEAEAALRGMLPFAEQMPPYTPGQERWPPLVAVLGTLDRPALLKPAVALAQAANKKLEEAMIAKIQFEDHDWWVRAFRSARAQVELRGLPAGSANDFAH